MKFCFVFGNFFIFNIIGKVYLGDSGSYLVSLLIGTYLIKLYFINNNLSPYYIALLLWYPAFENLFSLIRRMSKKKNVSNPDNRHLHQLVYLYFKSKNIINIKFLNSFSSIIILIFFLPGIVFASYFPYNPQSLILILALNVMFYLFVYKFLAKS